MRVYVGVTDGDWYRHLAGLEELPEVNFWQPAGGRNFRVLQVGEPFLFKTHYPQNALVGGGFYSGFVPLRVSEAWEMFGTGNGASTRQEMLAKIIGYRRRDVTDPDPFIGCVMLCGVRFFPRSEVLAAPDDFAKNLVRGRSYDLAELPAEHAVARGVYRLIEPGVYELCRDQPLTDRIPGPVWGDPRLAPRRLGQAAFKAMVLSAYERRCSITGSRIQPVLQAAHIQPVTKGGEHRLDNGLLLRSDVHTLFDRGYLAVDHRYRLRVSPRLREDFGNGAEFYARAGSEIAIPERRAARPNREFLEWHNDEVYLSR